MIKSHALIYSEFGDPCDVLQWKERPLPAMGEEDVLVEVLAAAIHPSDLGLISGRYGVKMDLPAIAGREGVGRILECGESVKDFEVGDHIRIPQDAGTWQSHSVFKARDGWKIPKEIPVNQAAMAMINPPTAWRLLRDSHLENNDWIIQNAANSAVGVHVIQMAKHLGLRTINVVRREAVVEPLLKMGADRVVLEDSGYEKNIGELTNGQPVRLALNAVGGESALRILKTLSNGANHVTYGGAAFEPIRFPTRFLIFNQIQMTGFWMDHWYRNQSRSRIIIMMEKIFDLMQKRIVEAPIAETYLMEDFKEALSALDQPRLGKLLFKPSPGN